MPEEDLRQAFLDMLTGRQAAGLEAPAMEPPQQPAPAAGSEPAPAPADAPTQPEPLTFEAAPPPAQEIPPAMAALAAADEPAPSPASVSPALMDLGHDAQLQGAALGLHSVGQRLLVISEGLKLIPALSNIARDLEQLNYGEVAKAIDALIEWAQSEETALMQSLEERRQARAGEPPAAATAQSGG